MSIVLLPILLIALAACGDSRGGSSSQAPDSTTLPLLQRAPPDTGWFIASIETRYRPFGAQDSVAVATLVRFANGSTLETDLISVRYVGQLPRRTGAPFLILAALGCTDCDINESIYVHSPTDGPLTAPLSDRRFSYPGRLIDAETGDVLGAAQMFWGSCVHGRPPGVVWFHRFRDDTGAWLDSVFAAEVQQDTLRRGWLRAPLPELRHVLIRVEAGVCHELPGEDQGTEP
jgi:hypothetical protein